MNHPLPDETVKRLILSQPRLSLAMHHAIVPMDELMKLARDVETAVMAGSPVRLPPDVTVRISPAYASALAHKAGLAGFRWVLGPQELARAMSVAVNAFRG